jgi:hypothetical protein
MSSGFHSGIDVVLCQSHLFSKQNRMAGGTATPEMKMGLAAPRRTVTLARLFGHVFSMSCGYFQKNW